MTMSETRGCRPLTLCTGVMPAYLSLLIGFPGEENSEGEQVKLRMTNVWARVLQELYKS
jgi:hypothetical protein